MCVCVCVCECECVCVLIWLLFGGKLAVMYKPCVLCSDFVLHQSVQSESLSVDTFSFKNDVYVAIAAPNTESCMVLQWDHIEMYFRSYDNITGRLASGATTSQVG